MAGVVNPLAHAPGPPEATCSTCVWRKPGRWHDRCLRHRGDRVQADWAGCAAHTVSLDCLACGACCREAYHAVEVSRRDMYRYLHPGRIEEVDGRLVIPRTPENWCMNLAGDYRCAVYADRPRTCRDFEQGGTNCVEARRRVGLTG